MVVTLIFIFMFLMIFKKITALLKKFYFPWCDHFSVKNFFFPHVYKYLKNNWRKC